MSDAEVTELERRIATGDLTAWPALDAALARAGRTPRRVWTVYFSHGEYSDRTEGTLDPIHVTKEGALAHMKAWAEDWNKSERGGLWRPDPTDADEYVLDRERGRALVTWSELVT